MLGIRTFADTLGCSVLVEAADKYLHQYFHDVSLSEEYMNLTANELLDIVKRDELHVISEEQVSLHFFCRRCPLLCLFSPHIFKHVFLFIGV